MAAVVLPVLIGVIVYTEFVLLPRNNRARKRENAFKDRMQCAGCFENAWGVRCRSERGIVQGMRRGCNCEGRL
jgi:hypothetical protein